MTRKDYILIATAIDTAVRGTSDRTTEANHAFEMVVAALSSALEWDNPHFDTKRFKAAACATLNRDSAAA